MRPRRRKAGGAAFCLRQSAPRNTCSKTHTLEKHAMSTFHVSLQTNRLTKNRRDVAVSVRERKARTLEAAKKIASDFTGNSRFRTCRFHGTLYNHSKDSRVINRAGAWSGRLAQVTEW